MIYFSSIFYKTKTTPGDPMSDNLSSILTTSFKKNGFGELHVKYDAETDLHAIVAIHSTKLGPALGGCRIKEYPDFESACKDALRLSQAMSYKSAMANLPLGGGKAVIIKPKTISDRTQFFKTYGKFINSLGGRYITALDSGTTMEDMDNIRTETNYVATHSGIGNSAPATAQGILRGIEAAVKFKLGKDSLEGIRVAISGVGQVGSLLAALLHARGAKLIISDVNDSALAQCLLESQAEVVTPEKILSTPCDVFSPCAFGGIINSETIHQLNTSIIAGGANNQLENMSLAETLMSKDILYVPDYIVNAGGLIFAHGKYQHSTDKEIEDKLNNIYNTLMNLFHEAEKAKVTPEKMAEKLVEAKIYQSSNEVEEHIS